MLTINTKSPGADWAPGSVAKKSAPILLGLFLFLLANADLEMSLLGFLKRLVIVSRHGVVQVGFDVRIPLQHSSQGKVFITDRAKRAKGFYVGNCHTIMRLAQLSGPLENVLQGVL